MFRAYRCTSLVNCWVIRQCCPWREDMVQGPGLSVGVEMYYILPS